MRQRLWNEIVLGTITPFDACYYGPLWWLYVAELFVAAQPRDDPLGQSNNGHPKAHRRRPC